MKRGLLILIFFIALILTTNFVKSQCACGVDQTTGECITCTSDQASQLTSDQLSQPGTLQQVSDLNQLNPDALSQAMNNLYGTSDFNLNGQSATISGSTLTVSGSTMNGASMLVSD